MTSNITNQVAFLRTSRHFPEDPQALSVELNRSYVDIAEKMNVRTIGLFATNRPAQTGNQWFITSQKQSTLRQIYTFTTAGNIPHGIKLAGIGGFVAIYGTFTDGTVWYPLPYVDATAANNQVQLTVTGTNIVVTAGGGSPPSITAGYVVLEWLSMF